MQNGVYSATPRLDKVRLISEQQMQTIGVNLKNTARCNVKGVFKNTINGKATNKLKYYLLPRILKKINQNLATTILQNF